MRLLLGAVLVAVWTQQVDRGPAPSESPVRGLYNWIHSTGDAERSFSFYRDVFGIELARSPFAGTASANALPAPIRLVSQAGSDALVWDPGASKLIFTVRDLRCRHGSIEDPAHAGRDDWWCRARHAEWASDARPRP